MHGKISARAKRPNLQPSVWIRGKGCSESKYPRINTRRSSLSLRQEGLQRTEFFPIERVAVRSACASLSTHVGAGSRHCGACLRPVNHQQRQERGQSGWKDPLGLAGLRLAAFGACLGVARDLSAARYALRHHLPPIRKAPCMARTAPPMVERGRVMRISIVAGGVCAGFVDAFGRGAFLHLTNGFEHQFEVAPT